MASFILKIVVASAVIAVAIKYGGPYLPIAPVAVNALLIVGMPVVLVGSLLLWRSQTTAPRPDHQD